LKTASRAGKYLVRVAFWLWIPAVVIPGSYLMGRHLLTLPVPSYKDAGLGEAIARLRSPSEQKKWFAMHVMYAECGCSQRILGNLLSRPPVQNIAERIVFVGKSDEELEHKARALGYGFDSVTPRSLRPGTTSNRRPLWSWPTRMAMSNTWAATRPQAIRDDSRRRNPRAPGARCERDAVAGLRLRGE